MRNEGYPELNSDLNCSKDMEIYPMKEIEVILDVHSIQQIYVFSLAIQILSHLFLNSCALSALISDRMKILTG